MMTEIGPLPTEYRRRNRRMTADATAVDQNIDPLIIGTLVDEGRLSWRDLGERVGSGAGQRDPLNVFADFNLLGSSRNKHRSAES